MMNPPHPGELLREDLIGEIRMTVTEAALRLGMSRAALSRVLHGHAAINADLALRLEMAKVGTARAWLAMQVNYDVAQAGQRQQPEILPFQSALPV